RRGAILFTTRDRRLAGHPAYLPLPDSGGEIQAMSDQEASDMFSKLLGKSRVAAETYTEVSRQLLALLENLPLAIAQAAAYIRERSMKLPEYLEVFTECEESQHDLLRGVQNGIEGIGEGRPVITTWKITVDD